MSADRIYDLLDIMAFRIGYLFFQKMQYHSWTWLYISRHMPARDNLKISSWLRMS